MKKIVRTSGISRRRAVAIIAAASATMIPGLGYAGQSRRFEWRGTVMGATARMLLYHRDVAIAEAAIADAVAEIARLETEFSLFQTNSALSRLNRMGTLDAPSHDMVRLMSNCRGFGDLTNGIFDITVQPLWTLMAEHFALHPSDIGGPSAAEVAHARARVDYRAVDIAPDRISLAHGMAVTLNGVAQGYIADRVVDVLRARGWRNVLVDLGELRAIESHPDGRPWRVALDGTDGGDGGPTTIEVIDRAIATSSGGATRFDAAGRHHHLFDPRDGTNRNHFQSVTVEAATAELADAMSTAFAVAAPDEILPIARRARIDRAWTVDRGGHTTQIFG